MNQQPQINDIDSDILSDPVQQFLDSPGAEILHWQHRPISYINTEASNLGIHRFHGIAQDRGRERPWSIVLKAVHAPVNDTDPTHWNYHRREMLAYKDGLLKDLPGGITSPRCLGIQEYPGGICWLWLEDVSNTESQTWTLTEYGLAARHLGQFNGAYLTGRSLPDPPWLSRKWMRGWLEFYQESNLEVLERVRDPHFWKHPCLRAAFPQPIAEDILRLWSRYENFFAVLDKLPQTFCHLDAYRPNLFLRRDLWGASQTVAIDWVFTGIAGVGEEIANLLAASLIWLEYDAASAQRLDQAIFSSYLKGLYDAGWHGDDRLARLGYTTACALRWGMVGSWWMRSIGNIDKEAELEKHWNRSLQELAIQWAGTTRYILDLSNEAYQLQQEMF